MPRKIFSKILSYFPQIFALLFLAGFAVFAWQEPTGTPPTPNVDTPLNVGSDDQIKTGGLWLNSLVVNASAAVLGNLGVGTATPGAKLEVAGDAKVISLINAGGAALPTCDSSVRGKQFLLRGASGIEDGFYICKKKADNTYGWIALASPQIVTVWSPHPEFGFDVGNTYSNIGSFSIPSDAKQWVCSYALWQPFPPPIGACTWGYSRILCNGAPVYNQFHTTFISFSDMVIQSSNGLSCLVQVQGACDPPSIWSGKWIGQCYYAK